MTTFSDELTVTDEIIIFYFLLTDEMSTDEMTTDEVSILTK
jgi:hypothetical protein